MNIQVEFPDSQIPAAVTEIADDASRLNSTPVFRLWIVQPGEDAIFVARLRQKLKEATAARRCFIAAGARHSMSEKPSRYTRRK